MPRIETDAITKAKQRGPMQNNTLTPTLHRNQKVVLLRMAAVGLTIALMALSAPLVWAAVSAGLGLMALAAIGMVGIAGFAALPLAMQKLENRVLLMRKGEARANPIEQLQNDCLRRETKLQEFRAALANIGGQIESMRQMLQERKSTAPQHALNRQEHAVEKMERFYRANIARLEEAHHALEAFRAQVKQKVFEWEFAQAGQKVMAALHPSEMNDLMQDLLSDEALRTVQNRFNTVFAELDVDLHAIHAPTRSLLEPGGEALEALALKSLAQQRSRT
jgi:hypothetical protein